jgi:hypothetical protein
MWYRSPIMPVVSICLRSKSRKTAWSGYSGLKLMSKESGLRTIWPENCGDEGFDHKLE